MLNKPMEVYAVKDCVRQEKDGSSSAGLFELIAERVIANGGVVFASLFSHDFTLSVKQATCISELSKMRGSKYVFGEIGNAFHECEAAIKGNRLALFVALPCQINALNSFLARRDCCNLENLITIDLVCHGAPSNDFFKAYLRWLAKFEKVDSLKTFTFRSSDYPWGEFVCAYTFERNGKEKRRERIASHDPYYAAFLKALTYRKCCYSCKFAKPERVSDITLGDAWGVEKMRPGFETPNGVSLMLLNTSKGYGFFKRECEELCSLVPLNFEEAASFNANLIKPSSIPKEMEWKRSRFEKACKEDKYDDLFRFDLNPIRGIKGYFVNSLPCKIVLAIRRIKARLRK